MYLSLERGSVGRPQERSCERGAGVEVVNVGGVLHTTTLGRLTSVQRSALKQLVEDRKATDTDGRLFIDRDGDMFRHVLDHLRDRTAPLPDDAFTLRRVASEAKFYGVVSLAQAVEMKLASHYAPENPRLVEVRTYAPSLDTGVAEVLCVPLAKCLEPLHPSFEDIPLTDVGRDALRLHSVKHADSTTAVASLLHDAAGYRTVGFSNGAILMQRDDTLA